jgi:hypothetical protein
MIGYNTFLHLLAKQLTLIIRKEQLQTLAEGSSAMTKYWIGVACKEHVENGVKLGISSFAMPSLHPQSACSAAIL